MRLRRWAKVTLVIIAVLIVTMISWKALQNAENDIKECQEQGYSRNYCISKMK